MSRRLTHEEKLYHQEPVLVDLETGDIWDYHEGLIPAL